MPQRRAYWICQLVGWYSAAGAGLVVGGNADPRFAVTYTATATIAIACTHLYRAAIRRWRWLQLSLGRLVVRVLAASAVCGIAISMVAAPIWWAVFGRVSPFEQWAPPAVLTWTWSVVLWSAMYFGIHFFERWKNLELEKLQLAILVKDAQLHGLVAQLQPHFLFNCLNCVCALISEDPAKAREAVTALSSLLRYALEATRESMVPLAAEIEIVRTYLGLEAIRFDERLIADIVVADDVADIRVPTMLVQSLVENGVKHGIERTPAGGTIRVAAWRDGSVLRIRVENPGRIRAAGASTQIGLANARQRLRLLYGEAATLELREGEHGVLAEASIPIAEAAA
ncbi:MAG: histidine kinase, partial [Kofleriaceae bacterium]